MTQGIVSSLNITLARMSSIESNFSALEGMSEKINSSGILNTNAVLKGEGVSPVQDNRDFKTILDEKMAKANRIENIAENEPKEINPAKKSFEEIIEQEKDRLSPLQKAALNLKSKIDLKSQSTNVDEIIQVFADKYNVDSDFIKAIIQQESGFNANAKSKKGAMGLMQLMPATAKSLGVVDAFNPTENIEGGVKYFKGLLDRFDNDERLALAAYNAGPNAVKRYGGIPPYKETQNYVNSIMSAYNKIKGASL